MSPLQFAAVAVVSYLGLPAGFFLASLTREELLTGRKYFPLLQRLVVLAAAAVAMEYFSASIFVKTAAYLLLLLLLLFKINTALYYAAFGALIFTAAKNANFLIILSSLVFLFGIVTGSAYFNPAARKKAIFAAAREMLITNLAYVITALALFLAAASF